ncbi:unnamed protein product [Brassicogethes aeneus]|uniref:G-protein coupled receptors family 1 profile domain-containing protein n=1 Tax=Brassicogethes aeneus TaxID=1431903 RepID=A0A9P0AZM1_BRAAE|nr:unnamed protein product [Brassicogethes aeneus]
MDQILLNRSSSILNDTVDINNSAVKKTLLLYDYFIPMIGILIVITNLAVVLSSGLLLKKGQEPRSTYLYLGNVALTDFFTGIAVIFGQVFPIQYRDHYVCSLQIGMIVSSTLASVLSVGLIAIDRFLYIIHGLKYQQWVYPQRARLSIGFTWIVGGFIGFLPLMGWYGDTQNGKICWFILLAPKELVLLTVIIGIIPILVVIVLYLVILFHALKKIFQLQNLNKQSSNQQEEKINNLRMFRGNAKNKGTRTPPPKKGFSRVFKKAPLKSVNTPSKWKAIKVVLFTTGSFIGTWSPYFIVSLLYVYKCDFNTETKYCKNLRLLIASPLAILGFMNSFFNPIIYAWWHKGFRDFVKRRFKIFSKKEDSITKSTSQTISSKKNSMSSEIHLNVLN